MRKISKVSPVREKIDLGNEQSVVKRLRYSLNMERNSVSLIVFLNANFKNQVIIHSYLRLEKKKAKRKKTKPICGW